MKANRVIAVLVAAAAVAAWIFWPKGSESKSCEAAVRPVRSVVIGDAMDEGEFSFSGKIDADASRTMKFKESGRIERIPVSKGQFIKQGELLAWLFRGDFTNRLEKCRAAAERDRLTVRRVSDAAKKHAVSQEELSKAEAQLRQSEAELLLAERALRSCELRAPFDCTVARIPGSELDMVSSIDAIVVVQDVTKIKINVAIPESIVIVQNSYGYDANETNAECNISVSFDSFPGRRFPVRFVEYEAAADEHTQTFLASYVLKDPPKDLLLLPGMSATIHVPERYCRFMANSGARIEIPDSAIGVDGQGGYFVWVLVADKDDTFIARRRTIELGDRRSDRALVLKGLEKGERIATAGVAVLTEGRRVVLLGK